MPNVAYPEIGVARNFAGDAFMSTLTPANAVHGWQPAVRLRGAADSRIRGTSAVTARVSTTCRAGRRRRPHSRVSARSFGVFLVRSVSCVAQASDERPDRDAVDVQDVLGEVDLDGLVLLSGQSSTWRSSRRTNRFSVTSSPNRATTTSPFFTSGVARMATTSPSRSPMRSMLSPPRSGSDLELLWAALEQIFDHDRSAARGEMAPRRPLCSGTRARLGRRGRRRDRHRHRNWRKTQLRAAKRQRGGSGTNSHRARGFEARGVGRERVGADRSRGVGERALVHAHAVVGPSRKCRRTALGTERCGRSRTGRGDRCWATARCGAGLRTRHDTGRSDSVRRGRTRRRRRTDAPARRTLGARARGGHPPRGDAIRARERRRGGPTHRDHLHGSMRSWATDSARHRA